MRLEVSVIHNVVSVNISNVSSLVTGVFLPGNSKPIEQRVQKMSSPEIYINDTAAISLDGKFVFIHHCRGL